MIQAVEIDQGMMHALREVREATRQMSVKANNAELRRIHSRHIVPLSRELRTIMPPIHPKTSRYKGRKGKKRNSYQPYMHLRRAVRTRSVRRAKQKNGRAVTILTDAWHYNFLNSGTIPRKTESGAYRGRIQGRGWLSRWSEQKAGQLLPAVIRDYHRTIFKPMEQRLRTTNHGTMRFEFLNLYNQFRT